MINIEKFQSEIQKNMQAMVNEYRTIIRENNELKNKIKELEKNISIANTINTKYSNRDAVIIFAGDNSGSMDHWCRNKGKLYTEEVIQILENKYRNVSARFINHHIEAELVNRDKFLVQGVSGETICSSAYRLINKELEDFDYHNENLDVFVVHISDGDNLTSDNANTLRVANKILAKVSHMYYIETNQYSRFSTLERAFKQSIDIMDNKKFNIGIIKDDSDVNRLVNDFTNNL